MNLTTAPRRDRLVLPGLLLVALATSSCITKRTVTDQRGGRTVEQKYVVKRPVKNFINNVEFE